VYERKWAKTMRIEKTKISADIFIQLKAMIRDGRFKPGDKLPTESELTEMFGVSRTPVREALSVLEASGMIKSRHGSGSVVQVASVVSLLEETILEVMDIDEVLHSCFEDGPALRRDATP
jgi:GntR family transcriptional repressor for pyruvate dehydrogenase complex